MSPAEVSMLMATGALVAVSLFAAAASYFTMRAQTDPLVLVFLRPAEEFSEELVIVIKNVGNGPAYRVDFSPSRPLPASPGKAGSMQVGPLVTGIPVFPPGEERVIFWAGHQDDVAAELLGRPIEVTATYESRPHSWPSPFEPRHHSSSSILDAESWQGRKLERNHLARIAEHLEWFVLRDRERL